MSRSQRGWYGLVLVLLVVAVGAFSVALGPESSITGSASPAGLAGTTTAPTITTPPSSSGSSSPSPSSAPSTGDTLPEPPPVGDPDGAIGTETGGDPYYPESGNGGYDAIGYQVALAYDPASGLLQATTTIDATVTETEKLGRFSFDLQATMQVGQVLVDNTPAGFEQHDAKLTVTPVAGVETGATMTVVVTYSGKPGLITNGTSGLADGGWFPTRSGGAVVIGEPYSASAWYPVNEIPSDRATFGVLAQVPTGWKVISNGLPVTEGLPTPAAGSDVFGWTEKSEMASYLTTIYIDTFTLDSDTSSTGLPIINAYAPGMEKVAAVADQTAQYLDFLASKFGPYPFDSSGGIYLADANGFALETQTRPVYSAGAGNETTVVHELAHQWFGDDVTVAKWADICLNECFASYAEWLWAESKGTDLDTEYRTIVTANETRASYWATPLYDMGAGNEFGVVYVRGPLALHALRAEMGDEKFNELLLSWIEERAGTSATFADFEDLVSKISGKDETGFLQAWFHSTTVPADQYLFPGDLHR